jgi:predicted nucleic acid-binding protein
MIVIDTMILTYFLVSHRQFTELVDPIFDATVSYSAPPLWRSELRNSLLQYVRLSVDAGSPTRCLDISEALACMHDAERLIGGNTFDVQSENVLSLAYESGCSAYDCEYVSLAQALEVPLVTFDREILAAFPEAAVHPENFQSSL